MDHTAEMFTLGNSPVLLFHFRLFACVWCARFDRASEREKIINIRQKLVFWLAEQIECKTSNYMSNFSIRINFHQVSWLKSKCIHTCFLFINKVVETVNANIWAWTADHLYDGFIIFNKSLVSKSFTLLMIRIFGFWSVSKKMKFKNMQVDLERRV